MEKKVRVYELHKENGTFQDICDIFAWLGKTRTSGHRFDINVEITEYKEETL